MAFDKNNTSPFMKVVIVFFAISLVISLCLPFFSGCSNTSSQGGDTGTSGTAEQQAYTVADVEAQYSTLLDSLKSKLAADPNNTTAVVNLGNNYMDYAMTLEGASDAADHEDAAQAAYAEAIKYYDLYLAAIPADDANVSPVTVDRCVCLYYSGQTEEAVAELTAFLETAPEYTMGWFNLGAIYYMESDYDNAKTAFNKVLELDPNGELGQTVYAQLYLSIIDSVEAAEAEAEAEGAETPADTQDAAEETAAAGDEGAQEAAGAAEGDEAAADAEQADATAEAETEPAGDEADAE